jgi:acyl dehydratase
VRSYRFPVEAGHIELFARALDDPNPIYRDPDHAMKTECGGIIAPPTFTQAGDHWDPEYDRRPHHGDPWYGSGRDPIGPAEPPGEGGGLGFHAEQAFEYHRPVRPGGTLTATVRTGERWEKQGRRGGRLTFTETITEYRDEAGELVVTARFIGVGTERQVT